MVRKNGATCYGHSKNLSQIATFWTITSSFPRRHNLQCVAAFPAAAAALENNFSVKTFSIHNYAKFGRLLCENLHKADSEVSEYSVKNGIWDDAEIGGWL